MLTTCANDADLKQQIEAEKVDTLLRSHEGMTFLLNLCLCSDAMLHEFDVRHGVSMLCKLERANGLLLTK